jgi:glycosyltransferase involved in cell wall biosynthesis
MILWVPGAVRAGIQLCRQANVDAIWASGGPWSNHLAAIAIGHIAHLPVVLDFRDVWAPGPPGGSRSHWRQWWDHRLERLSVGQAAAVVVVMESMAEDLRTRHPSFPGQRIICIPNGFDPGQNSGEPASWNGRGPLTLLYTGQMGGFRSARYLLQALQYGLRLGRLAPDQVRVNFVGANSPDSWGKCLGDYIEELGLEGVVEASEPVAYSEVQRLQAQADALIVFKGRGEALPGGALSSKIIDYLGAHRPILALAPQDSAIYNFIVHTGTGICAEPENLDDILSKIEELVQTRGRNLRRNEAEIRSYSRVEQTRRLAELLHELVGGHREKD